MTIIKFRPTLLVLVLFATTTCCTALSSSSSSSSTTNTNTNNKAWAPSNWKFTLNLGREPGTLMPEEWGAEGGRLTLPIELTVTSDRPGQRKKDNNDGGGFLGGLFGGGDDNNNGNDVVGDPYMLKRNIFALEIPDTASRYITMEGEQEATFAMDGGWKIRLPTGQPQGHAARFMCYVDLTSDIKKGDVLLKKGERIYLTAKCWREEELDRAYQIMKPIASAFARKQHRLMQILDHNEGDRRLDGTDPIQTLMGMKDTAQLVLERDAAKEKYDDAKRVYPSCFTTNDDGDMTSLKLEDLPIEEGPWPGQVEWLAIEPLYAMVRREKLFVGEEYHIIGTWAASPLLTEDDQEEPSIF